MSIALMATEEQKTAERFRVHVARTTIRDGGAFSEALSLVRDASLAMAGHDLSDQELAAFAETWVDCIAEAAAKDLIIDPLTGLYTQIFLIERLREIYAADDASRYVLLRCSLTGDQAGRWAGLGMTIGLALSLKRLCSPLPAAFIQDGLMVGLVRRDRHPQLRAEVRAALEKLSTEFGVEFAMGGTVTVEELPTDLGDLERRWHESAPLAQ